MATVTTTELVNEGHNILDRGIGVAYDSHSKDTKLIYRSREGLDTSGGNVTFLASTELGHPGGWTTPIQVTKTRDRKIDAEFLAYVIPDHPENEKNFHNEYVFSVIGGRLNKRTRTDPYATWSKNDRISETRFGRNLELVATSIAQTLLVYGWDEDGNFVEFACNVADADKPWGLGVTVPDMPVRDVGGDGNGNMGVTRTGNGICLLYPGAKQQIWWRHRDSQGKWGKGKAIITKEVHIRSPMAIMVIPYFPPPKNLTTPIASEPPKPDIGCYPIIVNKPPKAPDVEDPGKCQVRFAVAYLDVFFTTYVQRIDEEGCVKGPARRISRINAQTAGATRTDVPSLFIIPGVYPETITVIAISALHGREVLLTLSLVAPRPLVKEAAKTSALLDAALVALSARFTALSQFHESLILAQAWLKENPTSPEYISRAAIRDHLAIRYLLAAEEWNAARLAAWSALVAAIKAYNQVIVSCYVSHMRPIKTEVRYMDGDKPVFPITPGGGVLPDD